MNIEKEIQEAFEQFHAKDCNCNYEDLKRQLDRQEMLTGHRYLPTSPRHEAWLVFHAGWLASKQHEAKKLEGCVVVPVEPTKEMLKATDTFNQGMGSADMGLCWAAMLEAARSQA